MSSGSEEDQDDEEEFEEDHFVEDEDEYGDGSNEGEDEDEEETGERVAPANPNSVRERIDEALQALANLKTRKDKSKSRGDILAELSRDLSEYYGYIQELSDFLLELFSPAECVEYMDASDRNRPLVIRTNTLKTTRKDLMEALGKRGANVEGIEWSKVAIKVTESTVPIGATPEYLAGHYMLQSAASLNPVMALAPQPGERVLDMSAAPGGKTSYIAQLMKNSGHVIANDLKPARQKATVANLHRMGVKNAIICCYDGRKIPSVMKGFDRVLLDAPCSGLGVISRDQTVKLQRTVKDIQRIAHLQKELLCAAIDATDHRSASGGIIVYSTCSISAEENEGVVNYALKKRHVRLIETGLEVGKPGFTRHKERRFHPSLALTRRFYPHVHNMDGFYVAKLQKYEAGPRGQDSDDEDEAEEGDEEEDEDEDEDESEEEEEKEARGKAQESKKRKQDEKDKPVSQVQVKQQPESAKKQPESAKKQPESAKKQPESAKKQPESAKKQAALQAVSSRDEDDHEDDEDDEDYDGETSFSSRSPGSTSSKQSSRGKKRRLSLTAIRDMNMARRGRLPDAPKDSGL